LALRPRPKINIIVATSKHINRILSDVDEVNDYFAGISYLTGCAGGFSSSVGSASPNDDLHIHDFELEPYL